jgi:hypothetical protein
MTSRRKWLATPTTEATITAIAVYRSACDHRAQSFTKLSILEPLILLIPRPNMTMPKKKDAR